MDQVSEKRRYSKLPWAAAHMVNEQWHLHRWWLNVKTGTLNLLTQKMGKVFDTETGRFTWVRENHFEEKFDRHVHIVEKPEMERIYQISATEDITILEAAVELIGKDQFPPAWLDEMADAPQVFADPMYRTGEPDAPVKKKAARRVAKKAKAKAKAEPDVTDTEED